MKTEHHQRKTSIALSHSIPRAFDLLLNPRGDLTSVVIGVRNLTPFGIGAGDLNNYKLSRFLVYNTLMEIIVEIETLV